jgi:hypothetical protein
MLAAAAARPAAKDRRTTRRGDAMDKAPETLHLTHAQLAVIDAAIEALESNLSMLIALDPTERECMTELTGSNEAFCRKTLVQLLLNPQLGKEVASELAQANEDLRTLDLLRPRLQRLQRLGDRAQDTTLVLGNYVIMASLIGYGVLESADRHHGLEMLRDRLRSPRRRRFKHNDTRTDPSD